MLQGGEGIEGIEVKGGRVEGGVKMRSSNSAEKIYDIFLQ